MLDTWAIEDSYCVVNLRSLLPVNLMPVAYQLHVGVWWGHPRDRKKFFSVSQKMFTTRSPQKFIEGELAYLAKDYGFKYYVENLHL